jgi:hypothetical protein
MAKKVTAAKKKPAKEASELFHNIMKASVTVKGGKKQKGRSIKSKKEKN